jgi:hypothetical protein
MNKLKIGLAATAVLSLMRFSGSTLAAPLTNNLVFWTDAADVDGNGAGQGLSESGLSGNHVTNWVNKAPINGAPQAAQTTLSLAPVLVPNSLNGLPVVRFDGVDDFLQSAAFTSALHQPTEMFLVWKADSVGGAGAIAVDGLTSANRQGISYENVSGLGNSVGVFSGLAVPANYYAFPFPNAIYMTAIFNDLNNGPGAPDSSFRINGVDVKTNAPSGDLNMDGVTLGGRFATFGGDRFTLDGYIAEILVYSSPLGIADRQATEEYLIEKWALPEPSAATFFVVGGLLLRRRFGPR